MPAQLAAAMAHHRAGRLQEAEEAYRRILKAMPRHADALHFLGLLSHQTGRPALALELMKKAIARNGRNPTFHHNLGVVLSEQRRHREAAGAFRQAIVHNPQFVDAHYNLGVSLQSLGAWDEAVTAYLRVLAINPHFTEAHASLGLVHIEQGKLLEAQQRLERALILNPRHVQAHSALGNVHRLQGRFDAAIVSYERALELDANFVAAHDNIGMLLLERGAPRAALERFDRALSIRADHAPALGHRGATLIELGETAAAVASYEQAVKLESDDPEVQLGLAIATIPLIAADAAASTAATENFARALADVAEWSGAHRGRLGHSVGRNLPFYLAYRPVNVGPALRLYGDLMSGAAALHWPVASKIGSAPRPRTERLRLTIVSGYVHRHPVWYVILRGLLENLDRHRIEVTLYSTSAISDAETARARNLVDRWVQGPHPIPTWLEDLARHPPHVLFYPEVGMDSTAWALAALRLAPNQLAAWGHPITTGLPTLDTFVSGELLEGAEARTHYREKLLTLPGTGVCTTFDAGVVRPWEGPARPAGVVRFALCQQPIKFDPADDTLLARIAERAGECEFWLVRPVKLDWTVDRVRDRLARAFRDAGLDPERHLRITPWLTPERFSSYLDHMDVYLDCPAFSGYTTAWQAIHRGLPIVTLESEYLRQRLATGLLRQIGWTAGIAASRQQYVDIASRFAGECRDDPGAAAARRAALREAAPRADGNREAILAFERHLLAS